ncbi:vWA domain-containing protein [Actinoallomurus iriomotensis]|uniref:VWA domain-containing protein n=1 Tax=Actinoallomurus iriomotensis TaxID=478107 RepID=A0A9W6SAL0_9ACTN|nr:VWA domain-containing protein [Actinoallomurus iriomotensis]GLY88737.1 VWA domain-containing protein [Actinoallomurus iriomotensis]
MRTWRLAAVAGALSLVAACTGGGDGDSGGRGGTVRILAGSELADMRPILDQAKKDVGVTVKLDYTGTLAGVQQVLDGSAGRGHDAIWFSSNRYLALHPAAQSRLGPSVKIMSSPVLLGLRASAAHRLGWDRTRPTWAAISAAAAAGKFTYGMTNPVSSNSGFSALVGVAAALSGTGSALDAPAIERVAPSLRGFFSAQRITSGSSGWLSDTYAADPGRADGLVNYESVLLTLNAAHRLPEPLTLVYPADGVVTADYPLTRLSSASQPASEALRSLTDYLRRPAVQRRVMTLTHRRPAVPEVRPGAEFGAQPPELPFPARPEAADALIDAYFNRLRRPARTVYVLDVSGSMRGARLAALKAALAALTGADTSLSGRFQRFHDREQVTLLPFSSTPRRPATYVLPATGSAAALARIRADTEKLTAGGSTAIYESLEQAYSVTGTSSATDRITSIVLMSDGESNQGDSLADFRSWYGRRPLALRRIPVFAILFGESATSEMNALAALTHGRTFDARLQSLSAVFGEIRGYQ